MTLPRPRCGNPVDINDLPAVWVDHFVLDAAGIPQRVTATVYQAWIALHAPAALLTTQHAIGSLQTTFVGLRDDKKRDIYVTAGTVFGVPVCVYSPTQADAEAAHTLLAATVRLQDLQAAAAVRAVAAAAELQQRRASRRTFWLYYRAGDPLLRELQPPLWLRDLWYCWQALTERWLWQKRIK